MKIGLVIENFDPRLGGAEQWTWQFAKLLAHDGHEVHIVAGRFAAETSRLGFSLHRVESAGKRLAFAEPAAEVIRKLSLDVVHDMGGGWQCDVFQPHGGSRRAAFEHNLLLCPMWMRGIKRQVASWLPRYRQFDQLLKRQYQNDGRLYLALSKRVAGHFQQYHGVPSEQIRIVYNGVDVERFSPMRCVETRHRLRDQLALRDEVLLLIVAHNLQLKGVPTLLRAVGRLVGQGAHLHLAIAGGKRTRRYRRLARHVAASGAVSFLGPVDDTVACYAAADVYVQPTFYDPCSLVVLEALACGLPAVTSRFNGVSELMTDGREGHLIDDPADANELARAIEPLLDGNRRAQFGQAARRLAEQHSLMGNYREIVAVYKEAAHLTRAA